jgi:hypothetical protein
MRRTAAHDLAAMMATKAVKRTSHVLATDKGRQLLRLTWILLVGLMALKSGATVMLLPLQGLAVAPPETMGTNLVAGVAAAAKDAIIRRSTTAAPPAAARTGVDTGMETGRTGWLIARHMMRQAKTGSVGTTHREQLQLTLRMLGQTRGGIAGVRDGVMGDMGRGMVGRWLWGTQPGWHSKAVGGQGGMMPWCALPQLLCTGSNR